MSTDRPGENPSENDSNWRPHQFPSSDCSDAELLASILKGGGRYGTGLQTAKQLLDSARDLRSLCRMSASELMRTPQLGRAKASRLLAAFEIGRRAVTEPLRNDRALTSSREVYGALAPRLSGETREHLLAIPLDARGRPLKSVTVAIGGLNSCAITPAEVFRQVLPSAASEVIVVHNHPSGDPHPSPQDCSFTMQIFEAGEILGIPLVDHVIIGHGAYFSFRDEGYLDGMFRSGNPSDAAPTP
ncbi:MAG: DNA repair protein RadC [Myxococcota bacterium]